MGQNFDSEVKMWKSDIENNHLMTEMLDVDEYLTAKESEMQEHIPKGFQTVNISGLNLSFPTAGAPMGSCNEDSESSSSELANMQDFDDVEYMQHCPTSENIEELSNAENCPVLEHLINSGFAQNDLKTFKEFVSTHHKHVKELNKLDKIDVNTLKSLQKSSKPPTYQIIGDNLDMYVKVKHMSSDRQNKSIHWFAMNAIQDRVSPEFNNCPNDDETIKPILEVENSEFLPSPEDNNKLLHDFLVLFARVLIDKVPDLKCWEGTIIKHIPHQYSQEMKRKSVQVTKCVKQFNLI